MNEFVVVFGAQDANKTEGKRFPKMKIQSVDVHPDFTYADGTRGYFDIAVIHLASDIKYHHLRIQPICVPLEPYDPDLWIEKNGIITGYARAAHVQIKTLAKTEMTIFETTRCNELINEKLKEIQTCFDEGKNKKCDRHEIITKYEKSFSRSIEANMICAQNAGSDEGTCRGDSGK